VNYRPEIDGLRTIAVVPVILFHAGFHLFSGGFVGVDVFFVISGYLITSLLITELEQGRFSLYRFYERRARRILPALFSVVATCIPFAWFLMLPEQFADFSASVFATIYSLSNFYFLDQVEYFAPNAELQPLLHTWSLSIEEQYYLVFPLILMAIWRFGRGKAVAICVLLFLLSLLVAEIGSRENAGKNFFFTFSRFWEIGAGSICAFVVTRHTVKASEALSFIGLASIMFAIFFFDSTTPFPSLSTIVPVGGTMLIILFAGPCTFVARFLATGPLVGIGLISYSAYLWHQPLFAFTRLATLGEPSFLLMSAISLVSLGLAYLSWRFVEQPIRRRHTPVLSSNIGLWGTAGAIGIVFTVFGVVGYATDGSWARNAALPSFVLQAKHDKNDYADCLRTFATFDAESSVQSCSAGPADAPLVVLVGDSHADHYAHALRQSADESGYRFWQLTANSCLPIDGLEARERDCTYYAKQVRNLLEDASPDLIVLSARWTAYLTGRRFDNGEGGIEKGPSDPFTIPNTEVGSLAYQRELFKTFERGMYDLLDLGGKLLVIYPSPEAGWDVPERYAKHYILGIGSSGNQKISTSWQRYKERNVNTIKLLDGVTDNRISRFQSSKVLCDSIISERCINTFGDSILYYDDDHFSNTGANFLKDALEEKVLNALSQN